MPSRTPSPAEELRERLRRLAAERYELPRLDWAPENEWMRSPQGPAGAGSAGLGTGGLDARAGDVTGGHRDSATPAWRSTPAPPAPQAPAAHQVPPTPLPAPQPSQASQGPASRPALQVPQPSWATHAFQAPHLPRAFQTAPMPPSRPASAPPSAAAAAPVPLSPPAVVPAESVEPREMTPAERQQFSDLRHWVDDQFRAARVRALCGFTRATARLIGSPEGVHPEWLAAEVALYGERKREIAVLIASMDDDALIDEVLEIVIALYVEADDTSEARRLLETVRNRLILERIVTRHPALDWRLKSAGQPAGSAAVIELRPAR